MQSLKVILYALAAISLAACGHAKNELSTLTVAYQKLLIADSEIEDLPFAFCAEQASFNPLNALWMSYLAIAEYSQFNILAPKLEELGFGETGDGLAYEKQWHEINLQASIAGTPKANFLSDNIERNILFIHSGKLWNQNHFEDYSAQAFYAHHHELDFSVISFRGTEFDEARDVLTDLNVFLKDFSEWGKVHGGFLDSFETIENDLIEVLKRKSELRPLKLWLTGHSLGGALANLMAARIIQLKEAGELPNVQLIGLYSFGSPKVGNKEFADTFDGKMKTHGIGVYRVRNHSDLVSGFPATLSATEGYFHTGELLYLDAKGKLFDGESIEKASDYLTSYPWDYRDHYTAPYFQGMKRALFEQTETSKCSSPV